MAHNLNGDTTTYNFGDIQKSIYLHYALMTLYDGETRFLMLVYVTFM